MECDIVSTTPGGRELTSMKGVCHCACVQIYAQGKYVHRTGGTAVSHQFTDLTSHQTADNAIQLHKYNKSKDKFTEQRRTATGLKNTEGNLAECSSV